MQAMTVGESRHHPSDKNNNAGSGGGGMSGAMVDAARSAAEGMAGLIYPLEVEQGGVDDDDIHAELSGPLLSPGQQGGSAGEGDHSGGHHPHHSPPQRRKKRTRSDFDPELTPMTVPHRWVQLGYLSLLALLSDWICFSTASNPEAFEHAYPGRTSAGLIDKFLFTNVASCFFVTDVVARYGLQRCVQWSSILMALGCWLRSGLGIIPVVARILGIESEILETSPLFGLVPYPMLLAGTLMVGAAQPFFQCTPPLLSAQWFASDERATSTAVALNFNQIGIATAFLVGGEMAVDNEGLRKYFVLIALLCTLTAMGSLFHFHDLPPFPPSTSELEKLIKNEREPPFRESVRTFFASPGFARPLAAFVCSISITNVVGAFIDEVMERGGVSDRRSIAWAGVGFEFAIVLGGIVLGRWVDKTKSYKKVTLLCIALSLILVIPLGLTEHRFGKEPALLVASLLGLGFFVGPVQPINAELAVDVTYPGDETAVESVQQIGGNLFSALLVPLAERAAKADYQLLPNVPSLASDIRGDVVLMMAVTILTYIFFSGFNAPLKRSIADGSMHQGTEGGHHLVSLVAPDSP